jgi:phosphoribosylformylglycinamidine cyclo-ligase
MYKVFNMGHRMEVYLAEADAKALIEVSQFFGIDAQIVGRCEASKGASLIIDSEFGQFEYPGA